MTPRRGASATGSRRTPGPGSPTAWQLAQVVHDGAVEYHFAHRLSVQAAVVLPHPQQGAGVEDPDRTVRVVDLPVGHAGCWRLDHLPGELDADTRPAEDVGDVGTTRTPGISAAARYSA